MRKPVPVPIESDPDPTQMSSILTTPVDTRLNTFAHDGGELAAEVTAAGAVAVGEAAAVGDARVGDAAVGDADARDAEEGAGEDVADDLLSVDAKEPLPDTDLALQPADVSTRARPTAAPRTTGCRAMIPPGGTASIAHQTRPSHG